MNSQKKEPNNIGFDTYLIDVNLYRPRLAACYLIKNSDELALIDCGTKHSCNQILSTIKMIGASVNQVRWIIPTHVHLDHASGAGKLIQIFPKATIISHIKGAPHLINPQKLEASAIAVYGKKSFEKNFGNLIPIDEKKIIAAENNQSFEFGTSKLTFIDTPGHANHHGSIFDQQSNFLFTGDSFGLGYQEFFENSLKKMPFIVASTSPVGFDPQAWATSIDRMLKYEPDSICMTHFSKYNNPKKLAPMLLESINAHVEIALKEEDADFSGRINRILKSLKEYYVGHAKKGHTMSEKEIYELLKMDMHLNAQGLDIWLQRRSKYIKN